jgi:hypothetical protein
MLVLFSSPRRLSPSTEKPRLASGFPLGRVAKTPVNAGSCWWALQDSNVDRVGRNLQERREVRHFASPAQRSKQVFSGRSDPRVTPPPTVSSRGFPALEPVAMPGRFIPPLFGSEQGRDDESPGEEPPRRGASGVSPSPYFPYWREWHRLFSPGLAEPSGRTPDPEAWRRECGNSRRVGKIGTGMGATKCPT